MQSVPFRVSQNTTSRESHCLPTPPTQYGLLRTSAQASVPALVGASDREPPLPGDEADAVSITSSSNSRGRREDISRLSSRHGSSSDVSSPGSRVDEYERAHNFGRKKPAEVTFQLVPSDVESGSGKLFAEFPNEVLTHLLSHLPPETLSAMSLVSRRFHMLITSPHAWRIAFARYFPGEDSYESSRSGEYAARKITEVQIVERRSFTRLSGLASWRSEYILRTRVLHSLARGKPALELATRSGHSRHGCGAVLTAVVSYSSGLMYPVSHIHATFGVGVNKKQPSFIHGAVEQGIASTSDPSMGKISSWGLGDYEQFKHFADLYAGESEYGLGAGNVVGMANVMDLSQPYGKIYGEACPGGRLFYTFSSEYRGRFLQITSNPVHDLGIPSVSMIGCAVCSTWIAKSESVLKATNGIFGLLAGFSNGVLAAYALGINPTQARRLEKGEVTAKWVLSPGVPLIAICVDEHYSSRRHASHRIWAVVLNALGEVFYLSDTPATPQITRKLNQDEIDQLAWQTGSSVEWTLVESTRRLAKRDPFDAAAVDGSYTPKSSCDASKFSREQLVAEAQEIEKFLVYKPKHFQSLCNGWDMRRKIVVDFGGDDGQGGGEALFIITPEHEDDKMATICRLTRIKTKTANAFDREAHSPVSTKFKKTSLFGRGGLASIDNSTVASPWSTPRSRTSSHNDIDETVFQSQWRTSNFGFGDRRNCQISAVATDDSDFAVLAANEDPLLGMSGNSNASSPSSSPLGPSSHSAGSSSIPGHRARFLAVGTTTGVVLLWDMRAALPAAAELVNNIEPLRTIHTKSPKISSLALTALYVVHGGNDGLVQAWDPLASSTEPLRTLNSSFSARARRRIAQAEASVLGVGDNYYAAGAIVLDPDPTILRGMVSLGKHIRYWAYSSSAADAYRSRKRGQLRRRSERGSNSAATEQKYSYTGRSVLKDYITTETEEIERERVARMREGERLSGRFGVDLLGSGASESEILAYATMLSEESYHSDEAKRLGSEDGTALASGSNRSTTEAQQQTPVEPVDADFDEAIRLSLLEQQTAPLSPSLEDMGIPVRYMKRSRHTARSRNVGASSSSRIPNSSAEDSDLDFALQLSLTDNEDFPALTKSISLASTGSSGNSEIGAGGSGKGKGRARG